MKKKGNTLPTNTLLGLIVGGLMVSGIFTVVWSMNNRVIEGITTPALDEFEGECSDFEIRDEMKFIPIRYACEEFDLDDQSKNKDCYEIKMELDEENQKCLYSYHPEWDGEKELSAKGKLLEKKDHYVCLVGEVKGRKDLFYSYSFCGQNQKCDTKRGCY